MTEPRRISSTTQKLDPVKCPMCDGKGCVDCDHQGTVPLGLYTELEFKKAKQERGER